MFVDVVFEITLPKAITVPTDAILATGAGHIVFVEVGDGTFEPRAIDTGWTFGDVAEVRQGLAPVNPSSCRVRSCYSRSSAFATGRPERMIDRLIEFSGRRPILIIAPATLAALIGLRSLAALPLDALPDAGDKQVIVYSQWDRGSNIIWIAVTAADRRGSVGAPGVKSARGISDFGASFVCLILDDDTDLYVARSRTLENLSAVIPSLPAGVRVELGPDATSLGWVFQYHLLRDRSGTHSLADLRSYQDWYLKYRLKAVAGVSEIATVGGLVRQYKSAWTPIGCARTT